MSMTDSYDNEDLWYRIDANDVITDVADRWDVVALANDGDAWVADKVLGRSIWDCLTGAGTAMLYRLVLNRVRGGSEARFTIRCDTPELRRVLGMAIVPEPAGAVRFESIVISRERRASVDLLRGKRQASDDIVHICSWCKKVNVPERGWLEVEEAIEELALFGAEILPRLSHGICDSCAESMRARFGPGSTRK